MTGPAPRGVASLTPHPDGVLIDVDFDKARAKVVPAPTGPPIVQIGPGLYLERFIIDPDSPGFLNCAKLQGWPDHERPTATLGA